MKTFYFLPVLFISLWCNAQNGLYPYSVKSKWGLTNKNRAVIMEPQFDSIHPFEGDYARVENSKKVGLVHSSGKLVFPCAFNDIPYILSNGTSIGRTLKGYFLLDGKSGKQLGTLVFESFPHQAPISRENFLAAKKEGKVGIVNTTSGEVIGKKFAYDDVEFFYETELKDKAIVTIGEKLGVVEAATGREIIPANYDEIEGRYAGKQAYIRTVSGETIVYFDPAGRPLSKDIEKIAHSEDENYSAPRQQTGVADEEPGGRTRDKDLYITKLGNDKWLLSIENRGFSKGRVLDSTEIKGYAALEYLSYYPNDKKFPAKVKAVKDGKTGVIDFKGKVIVPLVYDNVKFWEDNIGRYSCIEVFTGDKVGILRSEDLSEIKKPVLKALLDEDRERNALLVQVSNGDIGYMDKTTGEIFIPGYKE